MNAKATKMVPCSYSGCSHRRLHWCEPYKNRPHQMIEVPADRPDDKPMYCSYECAAYDGMWSVTKGWKLPDGTWEVDSEDYKRKQKEAVERWNSKYNNLIEQ